VTPAEELARLQAVCGALAHPARRQILLIIRFRGGSMTAGEVAARFSCSWPTTTRHLRVLLESGLLDCERTGRERRYRLAVDRLGPLERWLGWFRDGAP
jgi:DNA-binding transcriptional ArsR family regulator